MAGVRNTKVSSIWVMVGIISADKHDETQDGAGKGFVWRGHVSHWGADKKI